jgi:hypothetical protein
MIIPVIGAPGTGKTTLCQELTRRCGTPHFELSWMPEFLQRNGLAIPYEEDEKTAVRALIAVAQIYCAAGHRVVLVSDFRNAVLPLVLELLAAQPYRVLRLYSSDEDLLATRVLEPTRSSGYRDVAAAQAGNREIQTLDLGDSLDIDVASHGVDRILEIIRTEILAPNQAI